MTKFLSEKSSSKFPTDVPVSISFPDPEAEIAHYQAEIARLQNALDERTQDIQQLTRWLQSLQQDITAVYHSMTWQMGNKITQLALKILGRAPGPTARDHIYKVLAAFESWKVDYLQGVQFNVTGVQRPWHDRREYSMWIQQYESLTEQEQQIRGNEQANWSYRPLISLFMYSTDFTTVEPKLASQWFQESVDSVMRQIYPNWELYLINLDHLKTALPAEWQSEVRFHWVREEDSPIAVVLNGLLESAHSEWIGLLELYDRLSPYSLYKMVAHLESLPFKIALIYTDEDRLDQQGQRCDPYFKSDWNLDLFYAQHFTQHLCFYRRTIVQQLGGFCSNCPGLEDYELTLRCVEHLSQQQFQHVPHILYHGRDYPGSRAQQQLRVQGRSQILKEYFRRLHQPAIRVVPGLADYPRVIYPLPDPVPLVSLIIPSRDQIELLRNIVEGILQKTDYPRLELIIVNNDSREKETFSYFKELERDSRVVILDQSGAFNYSQLNNFGVERATGEVIGLLNNDLLVIHADWLREMVSQVFRPYIGAVGAKLYYPNDTLQHAGVIIGLGGLAGHGFRCLAKESSGYQWRPFLVQSYSAVTGACMIMRREVFQEVKGLNAKQLKVAFNDVDLCLRLRELGYQIIWTPYAELYHLESATRGLDNTIRKYFRLRHEISYMQSYWGDKLLSDPYYNPNLTQEYEDFALAWPPRVKI